MVNLILILPNNLLSHINLYFIYKIVSQFYNIHLFLLLLLFHLLF